MKYLVSLVAYFALAACSLTPPASTGTAPATNVNTAIAATADTAAAVADALGQAPPATLSKTTIDERAIHLAFQSFDHVLTLVDILRDNHVPVPERLEPSTWRQPSG